MRRLIAPLGLLLACVFLLLGCNVTDLTATSNTSRSGESVTFTAELSGTPCEGAQVAFTDNAAPMACDVGSPAFGCTTSSLAVGPHTIVASGQGCAGGSDDIQHTVVPNVALARAPSSPNPSSAAQSVTFVATVTPTNAGGTVTFTDNDTVLCQVGGANGVHTCTTTGLITAGTHTIRALHSAGLPAFADLPHDVSPTLSLSSSKNPSRPNESVTFTAMANTGSEGTVTFKDGATVLCANVSLVNGASTCTTSTLATGEHSITATLSGEPTLTGSLTQTVRPTLLTASVASSRDPSTTGESVTFTAGLDTLGGPPAGGTGTFRDLFGGSVTVLGTVAVGSGSASITASGLATGQHTIEFIYNGDGTYEPGATASVGQRVTAASSTLSLSSSPNPSVVGQAVTLTALLSTGSTTAARGTVTFMNGSALLGEATASNGIATLTIATLTAGTHSLTATYANDPNALSSTASSTHVVSKGSTSLQLTSSAATTTRGQNVIFRARVTSAAGVATGTVRFSNGTSSLGSSTLDGSGNAQFSISTLSAGLHQITASYDGDARVSAASGTISHTVKTLTATVAVASSPNPSRAGEAVTITATVTSTAGTPTGSVTFLTAGTTIGRAPLGASGVATLTTTTLPVGTMNLEAHYDGGGFYPSGAGATEHLVGRASTSIQLASSPNPSAAGAAVTFTASITATPSVPITGSVEIFDGATSVGVFAIVDTTASFTTTALTPGEHTIRVAYAGNDLLKGSEAAIVHTVNGALGAKPPSGTSGGGAPAGSAPGQPAVGGTGVTFGNENGSDDDGCSVATPGAPGSSRALFLVAVAGLVVATRRRRR